MRKCILDVPLDDLSLQEIKERIENNERIFQVFVNIHKIVLFNKNGDLGKLLSAKECIFSVDGKWVKWLANARLFFPKARFGGLDVIEEFFALAEKLSYKIYLLGAEKESLLKAVVVLRKKFPKANIIGYQDGFFGNEEKVIKEIKDKKPEIMFLALPSPRKELLGFRIFQDADTLRYAAGVGGAFDILAGKAQRAPLWVQRIGMEWLYRCLQEPHRLFKRYFDDGIDLLWILLKGIGKNRKIRRKCYN